MKLSKIKSYKISKINIKDKIFIGSNHYPITVDYYLVFYTHNHPMIMTVYKDNCFYYPKLADIDPNLSLSIAWEKAKKLLLLV
jgi:hypothetical protein